MSFESQALAEGLGGARVGATRSAVAGGDSADADGRRRLLHVQARGGRRQRHAAARPPPAAAHPPHGVRAAVRVQGVDL